MPQPAVRWAEVAGHARSMRSREASTRRDRALGEPLLTPRKSSCPSPSPLSSVRCKRHESVMDSAMNTVLGRGVRNGSAASCQRESQEGRVLCPFAFTERPRCASRGSLEEPGKPDATRVRTLRSKRTEPCVALQGIRSLPRNAARREMAACALSTRPGLPTAVPARSVCSASGTGKRIGTLAG
jgi:hypothetical protein